VTAAAEAAAGCCCPGSAATFPACRPESDPLAGPAPGGSSPVIETKRMREQLHQLRAQLQAAQDGCRKHQQQQAAADKRAGEYLGQLQTRGELILMLQAQLSDLQQVNAQLRDQLAANSAADVDRGGLEQQLSPKPSSRGTRSRDPDTETAAGPADASVSSNGACSAGKDTGPCSQHEAVIQQLQQQLQMQAEQIEQLRQERAEAALAPPVVSPTANASSGTDDLAVDIDTAREVLIDDGEKSPASEAAAAALSGLKQYGAKHEQLLQQYEELQAFVKQLEAQGNQREALMGGLLAQVTNVCHFCSKATLPALWDILWLALHCVPSACAWPVGTGASGA